MGFWQKSLKTSLMRLYAKWTIKKGKIERNENNKIIIR